MYLLLQINHKVVQAIYLTLLHSLWQGLLSAVVAGLVIMFTQKRSSYTRYNLLIATMALFFVSVVFTFCWQLAGINEHVTASNQQPLLSGVLNEDVFQNNESNLTESVIAFFNRNANFIVLLWVMVVVLRSLQLLIDFRKIYVLKHYNTFNAGQYWNSRLKILSQQIGLNKTVILLQSGIAKVPMVVGHFKPVILFPVGIFTSLPQDEIEAILLHELAHIRRKDYIINMMQAVAELLFFFNPAVTWLSAAIRDERENCCDDIALGHVKSRKQFVKALVAFQEYNITSADYAATFPGRKNHLLNRVKRIITNNNKTLTHMEKFLLAACIVVSGLITVAFSQTKEKPVQKKESKTQSHNESSSNEEIDQEQDTTKAKKSNEKKESRNNITTTIDGKKYELRETNDSIAYFSVDGEQIPAEKIKDYQPVIDKIHAQIKDQSHKLREQMAQLQTRQKLLLDKQSRLARLDMKLQSDKMKEMQKLLMDEKTKLMQQGFQKQSEDNRRKMQEDFQKHAEQFRQQAEINQRELKEKMDKQADIFREQQEKFRQQAEENRRKFTEDQDKKNDAFKRKREEFLRLAEENKVKLKEDFEKNSKLFRQQQEEFRKQAEENQRIMREDFQKKTEQFRQQQKEFRKQSEEFKKQWKDSLKRSSFNTRQSILVKSNPVAGEIADRLKEENLVEDRSNMSFRLTNDELIVNGVKQPDDVQKKIIDKYLKSPDDKFSLSYSTRSKTPGR